MKHFALAVAVLGLACTNALAQKSPESQIQFSTPQAGPGGEKVQQGTQQLLNADDLKAAQEPSVPVRIEAPSDKYKAGWQKGGFLLAFKGYAGLCAYAYTNPDGLYAARLETCSSSQMTRWVYDAKSKHLKPNLKGERRCLSTMKASGIKYRVLTLLPCSDKDTASRNKKWRLAKNGKIVSANNALVCVSLDASKPIAKGTWLRSAACAGTKVAWHVNNVK